jgi:thiol-disulfide isomerase/thioredoxin
MVGQIGRSGRSKDVQALLVGVLVAGIFASPGGADESPRLRVGDPAPPLVISEWLKGEPIRGYEKGKIYVLDLWATWCGPCIGSFPELDRLDAAYSSKGVVFVAPTSADDHNTRAAVGEYVNGAGRRFSFRFAFCADRSLDRDYRVAAGKPGIPCAFIIDRNGKIAFIGSPRELRLILPQMLDGTWRGKASMEEWDAAAEAMKAIYAQAAADPAKAAGRLPAFEIKHPVYCRSDDAAMVKLLVLLHAGRTDQAAGHAETVLAEAKERRAGDLAAAIGKLFGDPGIDPKRAKISLAAKCFDAALELETIDPIQVRLDAIPVYLAASRKDKADAAGKSAVELAAKKGEDRRKIVAAAVAKLSKAPSTK